MEKIDTERAVAAMKLDINKSMQEFQENLPRYKEQWKNDPTNFPNWFKVVKSLKIPHPKSIVVPIDYEVYGAFMDGKTTPGVRTFLSQLESAADKLGFPVFLRSGFMSGKHSWKEACYVHSETCELSHHVYRIIEAHEMGFGCPPATCFIVREFIRAKPAFYAFWGKMPVTKEFRVFVRDGEFQCIHPYWPEGAIQDPVTYDGRTLSEAEWKGRLRELYLITAREVRDLRDMSCEVASQLDHKYWSVDWLWHDDARKWYLIDMAVGERSYHWKDCPHCTEVMKQEVAYEEGVDVMDYREPLFFDLKEGDQTRMRGFRGIRKLIT